MAGGGLVTGRLYAIERTGYKTANEVKAKNSALTGWWAVRQGQVCHVRSGR